MFRLLPFFWWIYCWFLPIQCLSRWEISNIRCLLVGRYTFLKFYFWHRSFLLQWFWVIVCWELQRVGVLWVYWWRSWAVILRVFGWWFKTLLWTNLDECFYAWWYSCCVFFWVSEGFIRLLLKKLVRSPFRIIL